MPVPVIERSERLAPRGCCNQGVGRGSALHGRRKSGEENAARGVGDCRAYFVHTHTHTHTHTLRRVAFPCVCPGDGQLARGWEEREAKRRDRDRRAMGGARIAFCGQSSMCLYAVMCYRFLARGPWPCCLRTYARARRYSCPPVLSYAR